MKKYEYKYVKREDPELKGITMRLTFESDETMLTGYGLEGWRVHSFMSPYWLLEREVVENDLTAASGEDA